MIEDARKVTAQALVAWHGNQYSVPPGHAGQQVTVRHQLGSGTLDVVTAAGTVIARHRREPDHAGAVVRADEHVTALENKVLKARGGTDGRAAARNAARHRRPRSPRPPRSAARTPAARRSPISPRGPPPPARSGPSPAPHTTDHHVPPPGNPPGSACITRDTGGNP